MGDFYAKMQKRALAILKKRGMAITLTREEPGAFDPVEGSALASTFQDYDCLGFITNIDSTAANQFYSTSTLKNTSIEKDDMLVVISALSPDGNQLGIVPNPATDVLTVKGSYYDVVAVMPLAPALVDVLFSLQVRR